MGNDSRSARGEGGRCYSSVDEYVFLAEVLAAWLNTAVKKISDSFPAVEEVLTVEKLSACTPSPMVRKLRRGLFAVLRRLGETNQIRCTDALKYLIRASSGDRVGQLAPARWLGSTLRLKEICQHAGLVPEAHLGFVCITHDVDWTTCQEFVHRIAALEEHRGIRSTFNFLTDWNYRLDRNLVCELAAGGFEIGLHGGAHDLALAYRRREAIESELKMALDALPVKVCGFRAPALSCSVSLLDVLCELGLSYDSSLPVGTCSGGGTGLCIPYRHPGLGIWEIPLTLQDSQLFRDLGLSDERSLQLAMELVDTTVQCGGVFVFNGHPGILKNHLGFYGAFLDRVSSLPVLTMEKVVSIWERRLAPEGDLNSSNSEDRTGES